MLILHGTELLLYMESQSVLATFNNFLQSVSNKVNKQVNKIINYSSLWLL